MKRAKSNGDGTGAAAAVRCAIYTRKSTEEGLGQDFNSLDAQRDAGTAYIRIEARIRADHEKMAALCSLAGMPEFLSEAISKRMTVAQVREALDYFEVPITFTEIGDE